LEILVEEAVGSNKEHDENTGFKDIFFMILDIVNIHELQE